MPQMIDMGKELIRISPDEPGKLQYSNNDGRSWGLKFFGNTSVGEFVDLLDTGKELLAATGKGLFYSTNDGRSWSMRFHNVSIIGDFIELKDMGKELLATTSKGLYYSTNDGRSWFKRS